MRLTGSLTEQNLRRDLSKSNLGTANSAEAVKILAFIQEIFPNVESAYTLHWIYESDIEILKILTNSEWVITLEIDRSNYSCKLIEKAPVSIYKEGLKKKDQLKLLIAIDMANSINK